jgi:elongation factor P
MEIENVHKNSKLLIDGTPYNVVDAEFVKPGKGRAIYRLRLLNMRNNTTLDRTYHSGEKVDEVSVTVHEEQFLYQEHDQFVFMNSENFEQRYVSEQMIGDKKYYLKEGATVTMMMMGDDILDVMPPTFLELKIVESAGAGKTDTITNQGKAAVLETGLTIDVPTFVKEGDIIKVDTRTNRYVERVTKK